MPITHEYSSPQFLARSASAPPVDHNNTNNSSNMLDVPRALLISPTFSPTFSPAVSPTFSPTVSPAITPTTTNFKLIEEITQAERTRRQSPGLELDPKLKRALEAVYQNDLERIFDQAANGEYQAADILLAVCTLGKHLQKEQLTSIYEKTVRVHAWYDAEFLDCHQIIAEQALRDLLEIQEEAVKSRMSFLFQAVFKHASLLLERIVRRLRFPLHLEALLWSLLAEAIISKNHRKFFRGRDLLTVICCFVFAISKLIGLDVSFNSLMDACRQEGISDFETAFLNVSRSGQNIVRFYNEHFLSCFKEFILETYTSAPKHELLHITRTSGAVVALSTNVRVVSSYRRSLSMGPKTGKRLCWTF